MINKSESGGRKVLGMAAAAGAVAALGAGLAGGAAAPGATAKARAAETPRVERVSTLRYSNGSVVAVVRMDRAITANGSAFFAAPGLKVGQTPGRNQGVSPASRIGEASRHCYFVEARRVFPLKTPAGGSRTTFGFAAKASGKSGKITQAISSRFAKRYDPKFAAPTARQMGCGKVVGY